MEESGGRLPEAAAVGDEDDAHTLVRDDCLLKHATNADHFIVGVRSEDEQVDRAQGGFGPLCQPGEATGGKGVPLRRANNPMLGGYPAWSQAGPNPDQDEGSTPQARVTGHEADSDLRRFRHSQLTQIRQRAAAEPEPNVVASAAQEADLKGAPA